MSREAFETAALAAHPTGESSPLAAQTMQPAPIPADGRGGRAPPPARPEDRRSSRSTARRGAAPAGPRASTSPSARFRSPTRTSRRTPTRPASWRPRRARWGSRPIACRCIDVRGRLLLGFDQGAHRGAAGRADVTRRRLLVGPALARALALAGGGGGARHRPAPRRQRGRHVRMGDDDAGRRTCSGRRPGRGSASRPG